MEKNDVFTNNTRRWRGVLMSRRKLDFGHRDCFPIKVTEVSAKEKSQ